MDAISWQLLIEGAWMTLWISAIAIAFGVVAGLLIALVRMLRLPVIDQLLVVYISLARADAAGDAGAISVPFPAHDGH
ncbi:Amino acid ABC transporter [Klebsiella pneumoniae]|uniref:Amino acid ABC transporter n=1 Tax=Klebsiella pneumoniae TaxID=573 RepID=A0A2X1QIU0_KLEPN|nr:Amino acid ABC transporter [Klebsiella pneumoniae]